MQSLSGAKLKYPSYFLAQVVFRHPWGDVRDQMSCGDALRAQAYQPQVSHTLLLGIVLAKIGYTVILPLTGSRSHPKQESLIALSGSTDRGGNITWDWTPRYQ